MPNVRNLQRYRSPFANWDCESWVRAKPHRVMKFTDELDYFSRSASNLFLHPVVQDAPEYVQQALLVEELYYYLNFTVQLELGIVCNACAAIAGPDFPVHLPDDMKQDALKIFVDEGGHAEMSQRLRVAVQKHTLQKPLSDHCELLDRLNLVQSRVGNDLRFLARIMFVAVSETLITQSLAMLPRDNRVQLPVREITQDHAEDEALHHAYFRTLFSCVWLRITDEQRLRLSALMPEMVLSFLLPGLGRLTSALSKFPDDIPYAEKVSAAILADEAFRKRLLVAARPALTMMKDTGVFSDPECKVHFLRNPWLSGSPALA